MHSDRGNKEFSALAYNIKTINKEIRQLDSKRKQLCKLRKNYVLCEQCGKHFRKTMRFLDTSGKKLNNKTVYPWKCPYCGKLQISHYETTLNKREWNTNDY